MFYISLSVYVDKHDFKNRNTKFTLKVVCLLLIMLCVGFNTKMILLNTGIVSINNFVLGLTLLRFSIKNL